MFEYDKYITNSLIITKYINIKIKVYFWQPGFKKGDNWNANRTHPFIFSWSAIIGPNFSSRGNDRQSSEENNRKLISLHNNGEDEKHAHGFADF